jgi:hypothetical protein
MKFKNIFSYYDFIEHLIHIIITQYSNLNYYQPFKEGKILDSNFYN